MKSKNMETIEQIRHFNRFYTPLIGILDRNYLDSGYSVTENRILFELYEHKQLSAKYLCDLLSLDKGYISRVIAGFEKKNIVVKKASETDGRSQDISLTPYGRKEAKRAIGITNTRIGELIEHLSEEDCRAVITAMQCIEEKLTLPEAGMKGTENE